MLSVMNPDAEFVIALKPIARIILAVVKPTTLDAALNDASNPAEAAATPGVKPCST